MPFSKTASPREEIQKYEVKITQEAYDILVDEGLIPSQGVTLYDVQKAIVIKEEEGEVTSSAKTVGPPIPDSKAGTTKTVNNESRTSGSAVGVGQWIGTFSGSADIFRTGSSFEVLHFTEFSGSLSMSSMDVDMDGSSNYCQIFIGAPNNWDEYSASISASGGITNAGISMIPTPFSGSFSSTAAFKTAESGSASGSRIFGATTSSNSHIPDAQSEYTPKWVSGSFPGIGYTSSIGTTLFTSSAVTVADLNNMSASSFVGSICVARGGFAGATSFTTVCPNIPHYQSRRSLNATLEVIFAGNSEIAGEWRNSGSLIDNDNTGALVSGLVAGTIFALAVSGSTNLVSGSIESLFNGGYANRGPKNPYVNGTAKGNYFATKRTVKVTGEIDKFQKDAKKSARLANSSPRS